MTVHASFRADAQRHFIFRCVKVVLQRRDSMIMLLSNWGLPRKSSSRKLKNEGKFLAAIAIR